MQSWLNEGKVAEFGIQ